MKTLQKTPEQMRAQILKTLQKVIANHKAGIKSPEQLKDEKDYRRAICQFIKLPRICPLRRCRRVWRCLGDDAICLTSHRAEAETRINVLLGWQVATPEREEPGVPKRRGEGALTAAQERRRTRQAISQRFNTR